LRDDAKEVERCGARLVAVAPHSAYHVRSMVGDDLPFPLMADPALTASATYGAAFGLYGREWTNWPAAFVIDREGVIRYEHRSGRVSMNYPDTRQLLSVAEGLAEKRRLIEAMKGRSPRAHRAAALALKPLGREAREAVPTLLAALKDEDAAVRAGAAAALCWIDPPAKTGATALRQALRDSDRRVRRLAIEALGQMGDGAAGAVTALVPLLTERDYRAATLFTLEQIGPAAVPGLLKGLEDNSPRARQEAALALVRFYAHPKETMPALVRALQDRDPEVRLAVIRSVEGVSIDGRDKKLAVPRLIAALMDTDSRLRVAAAAALEKLGPHGRMAIPALLAVLHDEVVEARRGAAMALWRIGPDREYNSALVKAMAPALKDRDARTRQVAGFVLTGIGPGAKGAVGALMAALKDTDASVRGTAATALGAIGPGAKAAAGALRRALKDGDANVRRSAEGALKAVEKEGKASGD